MIKYDSDNKTLVIEMSDRTRAKLFSLAALSAKSIEEILQSALEELSSQILETLEDKLSHEIVGQLENLDGKSVLKAKKSEPDSDYETLGELNELSHQLSGDEDDGENITLAEQVERDQAPAPRRKAKVVVQDVDGDDDSNFQTGVKIPNAGNNAEAFLDAAMGSEREQRNEGHVVRRQRAGNVFNPKKRQARVSEYTGDEGFDDDMDVSP